jgi:hypothetical protein
VLFRDNLVALLHGSEGKGLVFVGRVVRKGVKIVVCEETRSCTESTTPLISQAQGTVQLMTAVLQSFAVTVLQVRTEVPSCKSHFSRHSATHTTLTGI